MTEALTRDRLRHPLHVRHVEVAAVRTVTSILTRVTFIGPELAGFEAPGPADHMKMFFPDPTTGELVTPTVTAEGIQRPEHGVLIARDYTPLAFRGGENTGPELDVDFVLHGDDGPASAWAGRARPGDRLAFAGPRGSLLAPSEIDAAVIIADETALPAAARWLEALGPELPVHCLFNVADRATGVYVTGTSNQSLQWFAGNGRDAAIGEALRGISFTPNTFAFLAGEANSIVPLRRYLRRELGLAKEQVDAHGYWKRGIVNLDHHAPLDPSDPD